MTLPDPETLQCFLAAARFLNFRAAARAVSLTPAALGKRIALLEARLGVRLFQRTTRRVILTEAGLRLVPEAERALAAAESCGRAARGESGPAPLELTVGTRHELGLSWLVPALDAIAAALPHVTCHLYFGSGPDLELRVRTGEIDCAVTSRRVEDPRLDTIRIHEEQYAFVGLPRLLAKEPLDEPWQAVHHTLIDAHAGLPLFSYWRAAAPHGDRVTFQRVLLMGTISAIRSLVLKGRGVAVLPRYLVAADLAKKKLRRVMPAIEPQTDHFRLVFRRDDPRRGLFQRMAETLKKQPLR